MKTTQVYGLFIFFIVSIPVIIYAELFFSLGLAAQFALGLAYLVVLASLFYYASSSSIYKEHGLIFIISLLILILLLALLSI